MVGSEGARPRRAMAEIVFWAVLTTFVALVIAATIAVVTTAGLSHNQVPTALIYAVGLPALVAPPILVTLLARHRQLLKVNENLTALAATDALTSLMNRRAFIEATEKALDFRASPRRRPVGTLLIVDADNFKAVNDSFGHDHGDEALMLLASAMRHALRKEDLLGRFGGEEFAAFLPGAGETDALVIAERIRAAVRDLNFAPEGEPHLLSVSIGGAVADLPTDFKTLYRQADKRLLAAKRSGRDRVELPGGATIAA